MGVVRSAASLLEELRAVDESTTIEAKTASKIDRSVMETVCAFANEPELGGGYLLLGVSASAQLGLFTRVYDVTGVSNPDQLQADLATQCATTFNHPVRPQIQVETVDGRTVLVVFIPELAPTEKPLFLKSLGLPRGAFRRVGSTDQEGTDDDLIALYQGHQGDSYDGSAIRDGDLRDIDADAVRAYRELRAIANPVAEELTWTDPDLLKALGAVVADKGIDRPTVAGLLLFGTSMALRRCFPMMRIDYVRIPGKEWVADPDRRFDTIEIRAPLLLATRRAIAAVRDDLPSSFRLPEGETMRSDETILPLRVLREAIVNAVMHRSYRIHGAIQILRYANRLEVRNPGHSLKADEQLGEPGSQTRNPRIAAVLHEVHLAETKGSGIRAMRELMLEHDLLPPTFESSRRPDQFVATFLFHHFLGESDLVWLRQLTAERLSDEEARALVFVREMGAIDNAAYRGINRTDTLQASGHLRRLRDLEILEMKGSGNRTYYVPGLRMSVNPQEVGADHQELGADPEESATNFHQQDADLHQSASDPLEFRADPHQLGAYPPKVSADPPNLDADPPNLSATLPPDLARRIADAGTRPRREIVQALIRDLCSWKPLAAREIAHLLGERDVHELARTHLRPMVAAGTLAYTIPDMPNHPGQQYMTPSQNHTSNTTGALSVDTQ